MYEDMLQKHYKNSGLIPNSSKKGDTLPEKAMICLAYKADYFM